MFISLEFLNMFEHIYLLLLVKKHGCYYEQKEYYRIKRLQVSKEGEGKERGKKILLIGRFSL